MSSHGRGEIPADGFSRLPTPHLYFNDIAESSGNCHQEEVVIKNASIEHDITVTFMDLLDDDRFEIFFGVDDNLGKNANIQDDIMGDNENVNEGLGEDEEVHEDNEEVHEYNDEVHEDNEDVNEEGDSDFEGGDNCIDDVEVDMRDFRMNIDLDVENINNQSNEADEEIEQEVLNNEILDSGSDSDVNESTVRKNMLRYLRNANENSSNFYIGQLFGSKHEAKELIKTHAVETRRQLRIVKDDLKRVRAVCWGDMPNFIIGESGVHTQVQSQAKDKGQQVKQGVKGKGSKVKQVGSSSGSKDKVQVDKNVGGRGKKANPEKHQCPWVLLLSREKDSETWMVKTLVDEHKCLQSRSIKHCTSSFLCKQLMEQIEENPTIPTKAVQD
ncbi:hypothetical protein L1987_70564 [Smallanthus sonchifolius]|uniref:Uncharacterized protein n=1 Tax=Smallanthus sonchifolius TaxID=185202 RepID=A0ACB9AUA9_9ASTR|nr:hypothetical protein L1987_70564 [Smallanthus sonchifolius]